MQTIPSIPSRRRYPSATSAVSSMAIDTTTWMKTSNPSKATAPAMVTDAPWVATWSHWNRAATRAAVDTTTAMTVPARTSRILRSSDDTSMRSSAPPSMMSIGRMLR